MLNIKKEAIFKERKTDKVTSVYKLYNRIKYTIFFYKSGILKPGLKKCFEEK